MRDFEVSPEALDAASRDRSVDGARAYDRAVDDLEEWARAKDARDQAIRSAWASGVDPEEIASRAGIDVSIVIAVLSGEHTEE